MRRRAFLSASAAAMSAAMLKTESGTHAASPPVAPNRARVTFDKKLPAHPRLQYGASVEPNRTVRVIVQRRDDRTDSRRLAAAVGGRVREEFGNAKAHMVELPLRDVARLAAQPGVRYVAPDSPVVGTSYDDIRLQTLYPQETNANDVWAGARVAFPLRARGSASRCSIRASRGTRTSVIASRR